MGTTSVAYVILAIIGFITFIRLFLKKHQSDSGDSNTLKKMKTEKEMVIREPSIFIHFHNNNLD